MSAAPAITITIAIASMGRASLLETLASLEACDKPPGAAAEIVVADDDPAGGAARLVASRDWATPIRVIPVGARNISIARNALLSASEADWIVFVDDDERVARDWLLALFRAQTDFQADCVFGPVRPVYPDGTPDWFVAANPLYVDWGVRGRVVDTGRCGNTLVRRSILDGAGVAFDPALGRTGGEDSAFFRALAAKGARMVVTDDAEIVEDAPADRLTVDYVRRRALRSGQTYARLMTDGASASARAVFYLDAASKAAAAFALAQAARPFSRSRWLIWSRKGWMNHGKLREAFGAAMEELYAAPAGAPGAIGASRSAS